MSEVNFPYFFLAPLEDPGMIHTYASHNNRIGSMENDLALV